MEAPLPFIQTGASGEMEVNEDLAYVISQASKPVSVISIVGEWFSAPTSSPSQAIQLVSVISIVGVRFSVLPHLISMVG